MNANARMLHAAETARDERDNVSHSLTFDLQHMTRGELAAYYHGKQDAYEHAAQMHHQDAASVA